MTAAALGTTLPLPTLQGTEELHIDAGTQTGTVRTLRGKGMPRLRSTGRVDGQGDLMVHVDVVVPDEARPRADRAAAQARRPARRGAARPGRGRPQRAGPVLPAARLLRRPLGSSPVEVDLDGVRTWYDVAGDGDPLVYLHGGFSDSRELDPLRSRYAERFRVHTPDRRGHGRSPDVDGPFDFERLAADIAAFIERGRRRPGAPRRVQRRRDDGAARRAAAPGPRAPARPDQRPVPRRRPAARPAGPELRRRPRRGRRRHDRLAAGAALRGGVAGRAGALHDRRGEEPADGGDRAPARRRGPGRGARAHAGRLRRRRRDRPGARPRALPRHPGRRAGRRPRHVARPDLGEARSGRPARPGLPHHRPGTPIAPIRRRR